MNNDNAKVAVLRARQLLKDKRYPDALQVCVDELARGTDDPDLRLVAAHSLLAQGRHEGAKKEALQVVRLDPDRPEAHRILADVACARGELATACEHLEHVLDIEPDDERSRALFETLSRPSALPAPGRGQPPPKMRASSIERFVDEGGAPSRDPALVPELEISDSMLQELPGSIDSTPAPMEVSDSMLLGSMSGGDQVQIGEPAARLPAVPHRGERGAPGLSTLHDPPRDGTAPHPMGSAPATRAPAGRSGAMGVMDAGAGSPRKPQPDGTLRLPALDEAPEEDDAPTVPLLRPSAPPEPQLRLDPLASKPVSHEPAGNAPRVTATGPAQADPTLPSPSAPGGDDGFDEFDVEPASVPLSKAGAAAAVGGASADPLAMMSGADQGGGGGGGGVGHDATIRAPRQEMSELDALGAGDDDMAQRPPREDETGGLMAMLSGGEGPERGDDSLPAVGRGARKPKRQAKARPEPESFASGDGWDPEGGGGGGGAEFGDSFDGGLGGDDLGLADMMEPGSGVIDSAEDAIERELAAAGMAPTKRAKRGGAKRVLLVILLLLVAGGGVAGYLFYRSHKYIQGEWQKLRTALHRSTPTGFKEVEAAAKRILAERASSKDARAALAFHAAALAIEFGEDRLQDARKLLEETKGSESEWRTAARGYMSLIDDPAQAAGYLAKGVEVYPDSAVLKYLRGRALAASGALQKAADTFGQALKQQPKYVAARIQLAVLVGSQPKGYDQALAQLDELLRSLPNNIQGLIERARLNARHGKALSQAAEDAGRVTGELAEKAGRGQLGWAQLVMAQVAQRRGDVAAMSTALDAAIKAPPCCDSDYRFELAGELLRLHRYGDALGQMREALEDRPKQASYLQRMARLLLETGQVKQAAEYLIKAPARQLETRLLSGRVAYAQGRHKKAEALLKQVLAEEADNLEAAILLAENDAARKRTTEALKALAALQQKHPQNHRLPQVIGVIQLRAGDLAAAEKSLRHAWKLNGLDPRTAALLAEVSMAGHDYARADKRYNTALKRRADFAPAHIGLALLKLRTATVADARRQASAIAAADRASPAYHALQAQIDLIEGKLDSAESNVGQAEASGARIAVVARLRGHLALLRKKSREAVKLLSQARRGDSNNPELLVLLGRAQLGARMDDDAYTTFKAALKLDPGSPQALLQMGRVGIMDDEFGLAVRDLQKALAAAKQRSRPKSLQSSIYSVLALAYLRKGDTGQAIANLQDAIDLDPAAAEPLYHLGQTYDALKRPAKSVGYYAKAIELDPNLADAYRRAGKAYIQAGDNASAAKYLQAYLGKNPPSRHKAEVTALLRKIQ